MGARTGECLQFRCYCFYWMNYDAHMRIQMKRIHKCVCTFRENRLNDHRLLFYCATHYYQLTQIAHNFFSFILCTELYYFFHFMQYECDRQRKMKREVERKRKCERAMSLHILHINIYKNSIRRQKKKKSQWKNHINNRSSGIFLFE